MRNLRENEEFFPVDPASDTKVRGQRDRETHLPDGSTDQFIPPWKPGDQLGSFVLGELLGKGSSGFVYRACNKDTGHHCALKLLTPAKCENLVRNKLGFRRMIPLRHPGLIHVDRIHYLDGYIAFSMEEVKGQTFAVGVWELTQADKDGYRHLLSLMRQYASALAVMHSNGLVHRDIKPQNLMIDHQGRGRLIDYGLVGTIDIADDPNGFRDYLVGAPHFFAPESLWEQYYLPASDVFSLGLVMLDALRVLDRSSDPLHLSIERSQDCRREDEAMISEAVEDLSSDVPTVLREACLEMLQSDPVDRPTAAELSRLGLSTSPRFLFLDRPIIGREKELNQAFAWVDSIFDGGVGRLHIEGESGVGKSCLVEEIEQYVRSKRWGQLFQAKCRSGEDFPMQAFDQIADTIATRYMKSDREIMQLDPVSAEFLHSAFPVLKDVVQASVSAVPVRKVSQRLDAIEAGVRLSEELRLMGPLILLIDDVHWADRDSLNVLDRLQNVSGGMLGIITISRPKGDRQVSPPHLKLSIDPLSHAASKELLLHAARRWSVQLDHDALESLITAAQGSPLRLVDFTEEFHPGGLLHHTVTGERADGELGSMSNIERLWELRVARLSAEARTALSYIVTAENLISAEQLSELTGLGESIDAVLSELVQQRLVRDDITGDECISVYHDSIADNLAKTLTEEQKRECHLAWARLLSRQNQGGKLAARIAGHFFNAHEPSRAVSFAILAAEDEDRCFAKTESARWHARAIDHLHGPERIERIRIAAETFVEADRLADAAKYFQMLALEVGHKESVNYRLKATSLLIRSGFFQEARDQLRTLTELLNLPSAKPRWLSQINIARLLLNFAYVSMRGASKRPDDQAATDGTVIRNRQRLNLCLSISNPLAMFDNLHAFELNIVGSGLAIRYGNEAERILVEVGNALFSSRDRGAKRIRSEIVMQQLLPRAIATKNAKVIGDVWAGIGFLQGLAMRWSSVEAPMTKCLNHYSEHQDHVGQELCHVRAMSLCALWHIGRWGQMRSMGEEMLELSQQRNDQLQWMIMSSGHGGVTWLMRDQVEESERIRIQNAAKMGQSRDVQMLDFFEWISLMQIDLYKGDYQGASQRLSKMPSSWHNLMVSIFQAHRVMVQ